MVLVPAAEVVMVEAHGERLTITTRDQRRHTILYRLKNLEERLDPGQFVRLGRGLIVNFSAIERFVTDRAGTSTVVLNNGQTLKMSRMQTVRLRRLLQDVLK